MTLAALVGSMFYWAGRMVNRIDALGERLDAQGAQLGGRIDEMGQRLDGRLDEMGQRLDRQGERLEAHGTQLEALGAEVAVLGVRMDGLSAGSVHHPAGAAGGNFAPRARHGRQRQVPGAAAGVRPPPA